jgi:hypothetical protein
MTIRTTRSPLWHNGQAKLLGPPARTLKLEKTMTEAPVSFSRWLAAVGVLQ